MAPGIILSSPGTGVFSISHFPFPIPHSPVPSPSRLTIIVKIVDQENLGEEQKTWKHGCFKASH